ncbi:MAG: DNA-3-methyladenine glycosylase [Bowdeniella nasicola]|nr:DNA-3-methyladenine glycosylase [Bowdeniella nasicola]
MTSLIDNTDEHDDFRPLHRKEWWQSPLRLAPQLLGAHLVCGEVTLRISEVEAYDGIADPGSHAYGGITPRCETMAAHPGQLYVYFTYGMHHGVNLVCHEVGAVGGILIRAGEVIAGQQVARARRIAVRSQRGVKDPGAIAPWQLARGPGNVAVALDLTRADDGRRIADAQGEEDSGLQLWVPRTAIDADLVGQSGRIGIRGVGGDATRYPWRWYVAGDPSVSSYRPATAG